MKFEDNVHSYYISKIKEKPSIEIKDDFDDFKRKEEENMTCRQREVLNIYRYRHKSNIHKMVPIPIFDVGGFRNSIV